jgi:hypothetical protein
VLRRVGLIVVGLVIGVILGQFGVPRRIAALIALVPFALMEAKNLTGPYEKTAHEIMHEHDDSATKLPGGEKEL